MDKVDFKKSLKTLYGPTTARGVHVVDVPPMRFLMIDGTGDPNTAESYSQAVETLYTVAYALKFASKSQLEKDYVVPPLEGLWWSRDMSVFTAREKDKWSWTMMLMLPEWVGPHVTDSTIGRVRKNKAPPALDALRVDMLDEGRAVQALHIGSYDNEGPVIARMHAEAEKLGLSLAGKHHEIYLSDPRKVAPEKLRTILRQPVK